MDRLEEIKETEFQVVDVYNTVIEQYEETEIALVTRTNFKWLIETVEQQQKEIERLRIIEQAYEGMKKAL